MAPSPALPRLPAGSAGGANGGSSSDGGIGGHSGRGMQDGVGAALIALLRPGLAAAGASCRREADLARPTCRRCRPLKSLSFPAGSCLRRPDQQRPALIPWKESDSTMRTWTKSACVVLAWSILSIILVAAGMKGSVHPAQANTRTAGSTTEVILTSTLSVAAVTCDGDEAHLRYVVQQRRHIVRHRRPIRRARRLAGSVRGQPAGSSARTQTSSTPAPFWCCPAGGARPLHSCGRRHLVGHRGRARRARRLAGPVCGQPAGHRPRSERDPPGTVLSVPHLAAPSPPTPGPAHCRQYPVPQPSAPAGTRHHPGR